MAIVIRPGLSVVGGSLTVTGQILAADGSASAPGYAFATTDTNNTGFYRVVADRIGVSIDGTGTVLFYNAGFQVSSGSTIAWSSGVINSTNDLILARDAANTLALRNGTTAQAFRIYNTTDAGTANYERGFMAWSSNELRIGAEALGTGTPRTMGIGPSGSNTSLNLRSAGSDRVRLDPSGHLLFLSDASYDIGASGATRPRNLYLSGTATIGGATTVSSGGFTVTAGNVGIGAAPSASAGILAPAGTTALASLRVPHGSAPTSPVDGDIWTTTAGLFVRVNGATVGPLS